GGERLQLAVEGIDAGLHRGRLPIAQHDDQRDQRAYDNHTGKIDQILHAYCADPTSAIAVASVPQSDPPDHVSFFQIGTVDLRVSMPYRAASNASPLCGALATTTTELSPTASSPVRWSITSRPTSGKRVRISAAIAASRGTTCSLY